ncbi:hypothetical protein BDQ17DRAFT_1333182 [Cyathus striatus]|nr:hypothetical protein BDQ17DRAFT_1333182 [Cyathus striatus]
MVIGMVGLIHSYIGCMTVVMDGTRKGKGVIGAVMNTAYHVSVMIGLAIAISINLAVNDKQALNAVSQQQEYEISFWLHIGYPSTRTARIALAAPAATISFNDRLGYSEMMHLEMV